MLTEKIIVVSPHPDDETLGAGGTMLKYKRSGAKIYWLNVTNMTEDYGFSKKRIAKRNSEIGKIIKRYRFDGFFDLALRPMALDKYPLSEVIKRISAVFEKIKPHTVIVPCGFDAHSDHRVTFEAVFACTKTFRHPYVKKVLAMEVISETDLSQCRGRFSPNYFVDISDHIEKKIANMKIYESELGKHPFPRSEQSVKALAAVRGSQCGCHYAESFMLLKEIR